MKGPGPENSDTSHSSLFIPDSPINSKKALFVNPKVKPAKGKDVGLEFSKDVTSDVDYYKKIFETDCYKTTNEALIDYYEDMSRLLASAQAKDSRNMGAILGMTILGAVGFFAFSWTIVGGIIGGAVGIALGRYAGRKLRKRIKHKGPIIEEELYRIKMKCLLKLTKIHGSDLKYNLNRYRFILEKTLEENVLSMDLTLFKEPKKIHKELLRLKEILFTVMAQKAILLSYKLFKLFLQSVDINNPKSREEIAMKLNNLFIPYIKIMELHRKFDKKSDKVGKKISKLATYVKIQKLLRNPEIAKVITEFPDPRQAPEFKQKFAEALRTPVDLQQRFNEARNENDKIALEIANNGDSVLEPNEEMDKSSIDIGEETVGEELAGELKKKIFKYDFDEIVSQKTHTPFNQSGMPHSKSENQKNDISKESSESSDEDTKKRMSHKENVMKDPALFYDKEKAKIPTIPRTDSIKEIATPTPRSKQRLSRVCEDLETAFDPSRTTQKYEFMRMNSAHSMSVKDEEPEEKKEEPAPRKSMMSEISSEKQRQATKKDLVFQKVLSLAYDKTMNWDIVTKQETLTIDKVRPEGSPVVLIRCWATLKDCTPMEINAQIYDTENRQKWDTVTNNIRVVDTLDDGCEIIHFIIKAPFGVANRDFVQKRALATDYPVKGHVCISFMSITHPAVPPIKGTVRGETHVAGYVFKPNAVDPRNTDFCILSQVDIKGAIPKFVVNYVAGKAPAEWLEKLKKAVDRHKNGGDEKDKKKKK